jgi:hypothetical protein
MDTKEDKGRRRKGRGGAKRRAKASNIKVTKTWKLENRCMINNWTGKWLCQMQIPNPVQCTQYSEC